MNLHKRLRGLVRDCSGATVIEYALIAGIICLAVVGGATSLGSSANASYMRVQSEVWGN